MDQPVKKWSVYFQNPEFLERTRMFLIQKDLHPVVRKWCGVKSGMRILDVGCGTGYFTRLLVQGEEDVTAVGIDLEEPYIEYAKKIAEEQALPIEFVRGDAHELPFEDESFDLVTSHTFFTSVPDPEKAMAEMQRVIRPGGIISSVTTMGFMPSAIATGDWPEDAAWHREYEAEYSRFTKLYYQLNPIKAYLGGLKPSAVPGFFARSGLKQVGVYPIGKAFSLSNAAFSHEEKLRYIELFQASEEKKLDVFMGLPEMRAQVTDEEAERFRSLIRAKCEWHRSNLDENAIWEWQGDSNLLVTGIWPGK